MQKEFLPSYINVAGETFLYSLDSSRHMKEGIALALFFVVALAGIAAMVYPALSGSMTVSPCAPFPSTTAAQAPTQPGMPYTTKPVVVQRSGRTGDRAFFVDETGVIRATVNPNQCPPQSAPLNN